MNSQRKTPRRVTVTPPDPKYTEKDIRKQQLRVAPYCRVSTGSEEQETSFTAQMEYYTQRIADTEGWTMVKMYADKGISGTSAKRRPEFLKMIRDAEKGKIDLVITKSVSRFCRNTLEGLEYVRRLKKCGVGVYFEKDHTNTLYMDNEMILTFLMSQAQAESESMSTSSGGSASGSRTGWCTTTTTPCWATAGGRTAGQRSTRMSPRWCGGSSPVT